MARFSRSGSLAFSGSTHGGRYSWARYYHPGLERFIAEDPLEFGAGDVNLYAYVSNSPANFNDPHGLVINAAALSPECREYLEHGHAPRVVGRKDGIGSLLGKLWTTLSCDPIFYFSPAPIAMGTVAATRGAVQVVQVGEYTLDPRVARYLTDVSKAGELVRPYLKSPNTLQEIMAAGRPIADPRGVPGALRWDVAGTFKGSSGTWQLVVQPETKTILHWLFSTSRP